MPYKHPWTGSDQRSATSSEGRKLVNLRSFTTRYGRSAQRLTTLNRGGADAIKAKVTLPTLETARKITEGLDD